MLNLIYDALRRTVYCMIAFLAFLVLMPSLPPYINEFHGMKEPQIIPFVGGLAPNHRLENAEPLSRGIQGSSSLGYLKVPNIHFLTHISLSLQISCRVQNHLRLKMIIYTLVFKAEIF